MVRPNRGKQARATAFALQDRFDLRRVEARYDRDREGWFWSLEWADGPTAATMQAALDEIAPTLAPDVHRWRLYRSIQDAAKAIQAVRLGLAGLLHGRRSEIVWQVDAECDRVDYPERHAGEREQTMAQRLLDAAEGSEWRMSELLAERGLAWLLPGHLGQNPDDHADGASPVPPVGDPQAAIDLLTARYAKGEARRRWERQAATLPAGDAVAAALDDQSPADDVVNAVLMLLPVVRAEAEAELLSIERRAIAAARGAGRSWSQIGRQMHITAQAAQQRAARRADRE